MASVKFVTLAFLAAEKVLASDSVVAKGFAQQRAVVWKNAVRSWNELSDSSAMFFPSLKDSDIPTTSTAYQPLLYVGVKRCFPSGLFRVAGGAKDAKQDWKNVPAVFAGGLFVPKEFDVKDFFEKAVEKQLKRFPALRGKWVRGDIRVAKMSAAGDALFFRATRFVDTSVSNLVNHLYIKFAHGKEVGLIDLKLPSGERADKQKLPIFCAVAITSGNLEVTACQRGVSKTEEASQAISCGRFGVGRFKRNECRLIQKFDRKKLEKNSDNYVVLMPGEESHSLSGTKGGVKMGDWSFGKVGGPNGMMSGYVKAQWKGSDTNQTPIKEAASSAGSAASPSDLLSLSLEKRASVPTNPSSPGAGSAPLPLSPPTSRRSSEAEERPLASATGPLQASLQRAELEKVPSVRRAEVFNRIGALEYPVALMNPNLEHLLPYFVDSITRDFERSRGQLSGDLANVPAVFAGGLFAPTGSKLERLDPQESYATPQISHLYIPFVDRATKDEPAAGIFHLQGTSNIAKADSPVRCTLTAVRDEDQIASLLKVENCRRSGAALEDSTNAIALGSFGCKVASTLKSGYTDSELPWVVLQLGQGLSIQSPGQGICTVATDDGSVGFGNGIAKDTKGFEAGFFSTSAL